ncbi:DUF6510 family protein [Actinomadura chibensis]|uniref:Hydrogenase maturation nickel metallochaperone HypA n=1 Tax=Actinomadura chibensis TaxID=392828 RepID=A0A5D0NPF2_9ACTN|nr:DUF6510 family protein [Actinomadura chibensis]TYB46252.1 hypothetical protein FXF69_13315 [Actinomadura chibensis]
MTARDPDATAVRHVDGNALAGPLGELFAMDVTAATGRCVNCGRTGPVAALAVYDRAPGMVGRCPGCDHVMLRLVRTPDAAWLDLSGMVWLRVAMGR